MIEMTLSSSNSLIGGFGAFGLGLILVSVFYFIIYRVASTILPILLMMGVLGSVFLVSALLISFKQRKKTSGHL
jgi:hypothetical protein